MDDFTEATNTEKASSITETPLSLSDFFKKDIPPVLYFVPDMIQRQGKTMISAAPNVGKSIFVQNLALDIITCSMFLGKFQALPTVVLYLDLEMGESALQERFKKMCQVRGLNADNLDLYVKYIPALDLLKEENRNLLEAWIAELKIGVLILDPLGNAWCGNESDQEQVGKLTAYLNTLIERFGISIVVVHHWRKATKEANTGGQMAAGSYKWSAWLDNHITLEGEPHCVTISCHKNRNRPKFSPFIAKINTDTLGFDFVADYQKKYADDTLVSLFDSFNSEKVSVPDLIKRSKEQKGPGASTVRKLIKETKLFKVDDSNGKTHFLVRNKSLKDGLEETIPDLEWQE